MAKPAVLRRLDPETPAGAAAGGIVDFGSLANTLGYWLRRAQVATFKNFKAEFAVHGITPAQYSVLLLIDRNPGFRQTQIGAALGIKRANFVAVIDALEARGLATRRAAVDRRSYALHLTQAGQTLVHSLHESAERHERRIAAALTPVERDRLLALLTRVTQSLEVDDDAGDSVDD